MVWACCNGGKEREGVDHMNNGTCRVCELTALGATSSPSGQSMLIMLQVVTRRSFSAARNCSLPFPCVALWGGGRER